VDKAERTRAALLHAALELFDERGYEDTPVAAIAQRAGVTEMTFFRHFPSKEAVLLSDPYDPLIAEAVATQPRSLPPIAATAAAIRGAWRTVPAPASAEFRQRLRIVSGTPSLRGALVRNSATTEAAISDALISRGVDGREARIAAAAVIGGLTAALLDWADGGDPDLTSAIEAPFRVLGDVRG